MEEEIKDINQEETPKDEVEISGDNIPEDSEVAKEEPKEENIAESAEIEKKEEIPDNPENKKKKNKILITIAIILAIILIGLIGYLVYDNRSAISKKLMSNKYGFDYNLNKVRSYDWGTLLTDKKIARELGIDQKFISSAKSSSWEWVLNDPATFAQEVICASLLEERVLDEENNDSKSLINVNVMICSNTGKAEELFSARKDDINSITANNDGIELKKLQDEKNIGEDSYYYLIERTTPAEQSDAAPTVEEFAGLIFKRGPFLVRMEESQQEGGAVLSTEDFRNSMAKLIDRELKKTLSVF